MKKFFTKGFYVIATVVLFIGAALPVKAQLVGTDLETGGLYTALAKDASNNIYVTLVQPGTSGVNYEVEKYTNGTGSPTVIYAGLTHEIGDYPWGLVVTSTGDVYVSTDFTSNGGSVIRLAFNGSTYTPSTFMSGNYYSALAIDASNNLYTAEYDSGNGTYAVVKYPAGSTTGTKLYDNLKSAAGYTYPTGLTVASNGDVYVADAFSNVSTITDGGHVYKLTAASSYAVSTVSTGLYATALGVDNSGNLYSSENPGSGYVLDKYTGGTGTGTSIYSPLHSNGTYYPWGTAVINSNNIFINDSDDGTNGGAVIHLIPVGPAITTAGTLSALSTTAGTASSSESFSVSATNMTAGVLVTPPTGFEVSTDNITFTSTVTVGAAGNIAATPVYVRLLASDAVNTYSGNIVLSSAGATSVNLAIPTSTVSTPPPTTINSITDVSSSTTNASTVQYTTTFGASVSGLTTSNFSLTTTGGISGASIASVSGSGATYTITVNTGTGDGTIGLNLANATGLSTSITTTLPFTGSTYTIDKTAPTVTISAPSVTIANSGTSISYTVTFTDANMNTSSFSAFNALAVYGDSQVTGTATISSLSLGAYTQSGNSYSFPVTYNNVTGDGTLSLTVPAGTVSDNAGNTSTASAAAASVVIDNTPPTVTISAPSVSSTSTGPVSYTVTWSDANLNTSSISLSVFDIIVNTTGSANYSSLSLSGSGATRTVTVGGTSGAGTISISVPSGTASDNAGNVALAAGPSATFTVVPNPAIAASGTLSALSSTYGLASTSESFNVSGSNMTAGILVTPPTGFEVSTDNATFSSTVTVGAAGTIASTPVYIRLIAGDAAGNYSGNVVLTSNGATSINEAIASSIVGQAALTVTADNQSSTYGQALPALTINYAGFVNGDTQASLTTAATASTTATAASPAGSYTITPSGAVDNNYAITYTNGTLTIFQAGLTITADNQSSIYGQALPALTVSYAGFVNGDTQASLTTAATASTTATAASSSGSYTITPGGAVDNNYAITYTNGTLTIGQAALTATADNQSSTYGSALPALTVSYAGFVNGDTQASLTTAATASTTATAASPAGSYTITPGGAVDNNYAITYTNGTLTIGQAALTITADNQNSTYGQALPALTISYAGFVNGDTQASLTTAATASTTATAASPAGSYTITPSGAVDNNYTITYTNGALTIGQAALSITADNQSSTYGQALPALTVSYAGFVNGDTQASLTTAATASTTATAASPAGSYTITPGGAVDNNYAITYTNGTLTIGQAALSITADNQSTTYGQALPALTISYAGFVNGDTQASLTTAATASTTATAASPAGSYTITPSGAVDNNYQITYTNGTLTIGQAALSITADNQSSTYGQALPALTISYAGFVNGDTQASLTTAATASTTATAVSPVGSYTITPSGAIDNNYAITYTNGTVTIGQAALTVTADNQSSTYGQALPALTVSYAGFVNSDTQASLTTAATASTTATAASPAGSYTITPSGAVDNNYAITYTNGTLTIGQAALSITADNQSSTYGQALPALTVSYAGFVNGDTQASLTTAATASTTATAASPAGSYTITPSGAVDNNYAIAYTNGTLTIGQAALTVTADNQSTTYGQALPALTVSYAGFVNGDTQASLTTAATASTTATAASPAGSYTIMPSGAVDNNYAITYTNGTLTIGQAGLIVTADSQSTTYGQALPALTISYAGFVNGDTQASLTTAATASTTATAASPAGSYTITPSGAVDNNYTITYTNGTLTIGQAGLIVTADSQSTTYGQALPALTISYAGFVNGDTQASLTTAATASTTATAASPAGSYTITPSGAVDNNYTITYTNGTLTIGQAGLIVTADSQSTTYGQALPALTISYAGFVNGDTQASLTTAATASTTATAASPAGSYTITPSGAVDNNYAITYTNGTLTIGQAGLIVTADSQSTTYGQALPALTISYAGFVNGDTQASLTTAATASTTATAASPAGSYTITPSGAVDNNYTITYTNGTLTIGQAGLIVTADSQSTTYGQALPALTISYAGFVNGDTQASLTTAATASTTATAASPAGSYTITPSGAVDNNYAITYTNGTLTIGQAALTVTADNQSSTYGQALPALTVSYAGFVNGDTQASLTTAATASTTATAASPAGSYTITPGGAVDNSYAITYTNGTLTIGQAALTVTADNQSSTYGQALPALTVSYAGFVNGDTQASLTTGATASTTATAASPAGSYTITPSGAVDNNYSITYANGTLTIGQAGLTVTADNQSSTYGSALPALTVSYAGFVNGDTQASLTTAATASTTATAASSAGSYTITPSGVVDNNYAITYTNGTLTIGQAALTITADNQSSTYGSALPALTVSYAGFVNGDTQASLTTAATASTTATAASPAGSYTITPSGAVDNNYAITYANGTLTIGQAALSITANNQNTTYGQALPALTISYAGFVNGDTQASLTTAATASTTATAASPAGSYTITPSGAVDNNYAITYTNGTLTIGQAALSITADNQSSTYGQALPTLTASYAGFVNGDSAASLSTAPTLITTATAASPVNTYPITVSGAVDNNYTITYTNGTLTIGQAALTVTADNQSSTYGQALPALTVSYAGFVNGDTKVSLTTAATASTTATAASPAGSYTITPSGAVDNNYQITYTNGTLTIGQAALTITADNQSTTYGQAVPPLTVSYAGFVNGDTQASLTTAATASTTATAASPAGSYTITPGGAVDNNYQITYTNGTLTIGQAALTITADNQSSTYGQAIPTLTASYSGFVNGDNAASLTTAPAITTTATATSPVGMYPITAIGAVDHNYQITYAAGTLTIGEALRSVNFPGVTTKNYGDADFGPGATSSTGEAILYTSSNPAVATIVNSQIHITGVGTTTITATLAANSNYSDDPSISRELVVNKGQQTISFAPIPNQQRGSTYDLSGVTASSGLAVTITSANPFVALINGQSLKAQTLGMTTITASQAGNENYEAATSVMQEIKVTDAAGDDIIVHQGVSPNGDGINDYLYIEGIGNYPQNQVTLMNRNGVVIFQGFNYDNTNHVFDGHSNITGALQQAGTYFYRVELVVNGEHVSKTGYIVLKYQ